MDVAETPAMSSTECRCCGPQYFHDRVGTMLIDNVTSAGEIDSTSKNAERSYSSGIVGRTSTVVFRNAVNKASVTAQKQSCGFVSMVENELSTGIHVENSINTGTLTAANVFGFSESVTSATNVVNMGTLCVKQAISAALCKLLDTITTIAAQTLGNKQVVTGTRLALFPQDLFLDVP